MSLWALELGPLHIVNSEHHLKLSVLSFANIRIPWSISSLENDAIVKALTSGNLWVSRGAACRLDIRVFYNGNPLDRNGRINILESLGYRIRDAQLWSQLSLSASLDVWQTDDSTDLARDLSIKINHGMEPSNPQTRNRAWTLDNFDTKPPDSALCAKFEGMQIQFDFLDIRDEVKSSKRVKSDAAGFDAKELMLLDSAPNSDSHDKTNDLTHAIERMKSLPSLIEQCFGSRVDSNDHSAPIQQFPLSYWGQDQASHILRQTWDVVEIPLEKEKSLGSKRSGHSKETIETLNVWLEAHKRNPYPSTAEKQELMRRTGLKLHQVNNWFQHHRRRLRREDSLTRDEILLEQIGEGNKLTEQCVHDEDNDMLLSQATDSVPSLTSQSSIAASILSTGHGDSSLKRRLLGNEAISLDRFPFCELGEVAVHVLIGGYFARCLRGFGGVQVEKPSSSLSLTSIAPAVFCPGFKESMAHNSHFVSKISHALSISWPRNVQSPSLQQKLTQLANSPPSLLASESCDGDGEAGTTTRLAAVVQSRLWGMMQRKLYDPSNAAKIWRKSTSQENPPDDECLDLLGMLGEGEENPVITDLSGFSENELDEFEDLLSGDDEELIEYLEKRERLYIERETDEKLFGGTWEEDEDDEKKVSLLDGEAGSDIMLL